MKSKFVKTSLTMALVALMPFNTMANFSSPFEDQGEKPLLFAEDEIEIEKPVAVIPKGPVNKVTRQVVKAQPIEVAKKPIAKPKMSEESSLVLDGADEMDAAKERLAAIKRESEDAKKLAQKREMEALALEADLNKKVEIKRQEELKQKLLKERLERELLEKTRAEELKKSRLEKERIEREFQEIKRLEEERKKQEEQARLERIKAEALAKVRAEEENRLRLIAEADARKKLEAERKAQEAALKAENERKAQEAALKAANERKAQEAALKAENERKAQEAALKAANERKAQEAALRAANERKAQEAAMKAENERKAQEAAMKAENERKAHEAALKAANDRQAQEAAQKANSSNVQIGAIPKQPITNGTTMGYTYANRATQSALQKATSKIAVDPSKMPLRNRVLGFTASKDQIKALDDRYQYNSSRMSVMPAEVGSIKLLPTARLTGDSIALFATAKEKQIVEEYLSYNPLHSQVFSNYVTRIMTMNNGQTGGVSVDKALMDELTYSFATTPVRSSTLREAQDQYLYITARLTNEDQVKFWNWVNTVKTGDEIRVPTWIGLADVMYSQ